MLKTTKTLAKALAVCAACVAVGALSALGSLAMGRWAEARQQVMDVAAFVTDAEGDLSEFIGE